MCFRKERALFFVKNLLTEAFLCAMVGQRSSGAFLFLREKSGTAADLTAEARILHLPEATAGGIHGFSRGMEPGRRSDDSSAYFWRFGMRTRITLSCTECKQRNYNTTKDKKTHPERLEMKKYCRFCRKHTVHKETK